MMTSENINRRLFYIQIFNTSYNNYNIINHIKNNFLMHVYIKNGGISVV